MDRVWRRDGRPATGRAAPLAPRPSPRLGAALAALPLLALRSLFSSRDAPLSGLSDRQLGDIGLARADVARPGERTASAELEMLRLLRGRGWR